MECFAGHLGGMVVGDAGFLEPIYGTAAGIYLNGQRDKSEQRSHRIQADTYPQQNIVCLIKEYQTGQDDPHRPPIREIDHRHQRRAELKRSIRTLVLHGMTTLVGCHSCGCHVGRTIHRF